jgi:hypothetical protein
MNRFAAAKEKYSGLDNAGLREQTLCLCQDIRSYYNQFQLSESSATEGEVLITELLRSTNRTLPNLWRSAELTHLCSTKLTQWFKAGAVLFLSK